MKINKRTLTILLSGLILLATPMLAAARGGDRYDERGSHHQDTRIEKRYSQDQNRHHASHSWQRPQLKKSHKKPLYSKNWKHRARHHYAPAHRVAAVPIPRIKPHLKAVSPVSVLLGLPPLVVHIDW